MLFFTDEYSGRRCQSGSWSKVRGIFRRSKSTVVSRSFSNKVSGLRLFCNDRKSGLSGLLWRDLLGGATYIAESLFGICLWTCLGPQVRRDVLQGRAAHLIIGYTNHYIHRQNSPHCTLGLALLSCEGLALSIKLICCHACKWNVFLV